MKMIVCAVFDKAVEAFLPPLLFRSRGEAVRSFVDATRSNTQFSSNPQDYVFMQLAVFDDNLGQFDNLDAPETLMLGLNVSKEPDAAV